MDPKHASRLQRASAQMGAIDLLTTTLREHVQMVAGIAEDPERVKHASGLLREALRILAQSDTNGGRSCVIAKATVIAAATVRDDGEDVDEALCRALESAAVLDPELPGAVAATAGVFDALEGAVRVLVAERTNEQQLWLPHLHEALTRLRLVDGKEDATRMALKRACARAVDRPDARGRHRLLHLLSDD